MLTSSPRVICDMRPRIGQARAARQCLTPVSNKTYTISSPLFLGPRLRRGGGDDDGGILAQQEPLLLQRLRSGADPVHVVVAVLVVGGDLRRGEGQEGAGQGAGEALGILLRAMDAER